jgi:hypothetical protein
VISGVVSMADKPAPAFAALSGIELPAAASYAIVCSP